jgi:hypothetical protein
MESETSSSGIHNSHDRESLLRLLQQFNNDTNAAVQTLDGIVSAVDRVQTVCSSVIEQTTDMRVIHTNARLVRKKLRHIDKWKGSAREVESILTSKKYEKLDQAVYTLIDAEAFINTEDCPLTAEHQRSLAREIKLAKKRASEYFIQKWITSCQKMTASNAAHIATNSTVSTSLPIIGTLTNTPINENEIKAVDYSPSISNILLKLGCSEECISSYVAVREPFVKARFHQLCKTICSKEKFTASNNNICFSIFSLQIIIREEIDFLTIMYGGTNYHNNDVKHNDGGIGLESIISKKCFNLVIDQFIGSYIRKKLNNLLLKYNFNYDHTLECLNKDDILKDVDNEKKKKKKKKIKNKKNPLNF